MVSVDVVRANVKRSVLAQLVELYAVKGITSTAELAQIIGRSARQIWRAKAELSQAKEPGSTSPDVRVGSSRRAARGRRPEPGRAIPGTDTHDTDTHDSVTPMTVSPVSAPKGSPLQDKKKNPPHPLKEKTQPSLSQTNTTASLKGTRGPAKIESQQQLESRQQLEIVAGLKERFKLDPRKTERVVAELSRQHGVPFVRAGWRRLRLDAEEGTEITHPLGLLRALTTRIRHETPAGARVRDDGSYLSRWM